MSCTLLVSSLLAIAITYYFTIKVPEDAGEPPSQQTVK